MVLTPPPPHSSNDDKIHRNCPNERGDWKLFFLPTTNIHPSSSLSSSYNHTSTNILTSLIESVDQLSISKTFMIEPPRISLTCLNLMKEWLISDVFPYSDFRYDNCMTNMVSFDFDDWFISLLCRWLSECCKLNCSIINIRIILLSIANIHWMITQQRGRGRKPEREIDIKAYVPSSNIHSNDVNELLLNVSGDLFNSNLLIDIEAVFELFCSFLLRHSISYSAESIDYLAPTIVQHFSQLFTTDYIRFIHLIQTSKRIQQQYTIKLYSQTEFNQTCNPIRSTRLEVKEKEKEKEKEKGDIDIEIDIGIDVENKRYVFDSEIQKSIDSLIEKL